jgi:hypothetical protein
MRARTPETTKITARIHRISAIRLTSYFQQGAILGGEWLAAAGTRRLNLGLMNDALWSGPSFR